MGQVEQNVANRYLKKASLQRLLERLFPGQTEFNIEVCLAAKALPYPLLRLNRSLQMRDDVWHFKAPKEVDSAEIE
ncbi:corA-like mg2+ transporter protein domain-containing protein [Colletotrichum asianum]